MLWQVKSTVKEADSMRAPISTAQKWIACRSMRIRRSLGRGAVADKLIV